jgi:hypothetical protein
MGDYGLGANISFTLDETGLTTTSTADRPPDPKPIPITTTTSGTSVIGAILTAAHLEHDKAVAEAEAAAIEKAAQFDAARIRAAAAHAAKVEREQAAAAKAVADAKAKELAARMAALSAASQLTLAQWQKKKAEEAAVAAQAPMMPAPEEAGSKTGLYVGLALAALVIGGGALLLLGKKKPAAATATANRRRSYRGNPRERAVYATSFCNFGHDLRTGRPIGHECEILPPAALRAEREGDVPRAIEIMEQHRRRYGRRYVRGRALKPNRRHARRR